MQLYENYIHINNNIKPFYVSILFFEIHDRRLLVTAEELLNFYKYEKVVKQEEYDILASKYGIFNEKIKSVIDSSKSELLNEIIIKPIYQIFNESELASLKNVLIDIIPCSKINAYSIKADNNEYLIIINERLMGLISSFHQLELYSIQKLSSDKDETDFAKNFSPILDCFLNPLSGNTLPVLSYKELPSKLQHLALIKTIMCEQFILAHELAHIYLGHLKSASDHSIINDEFWVTYTANNDSQQMEFDADIQATKWIISLSKVKSNFNPLQNSLLLFINVFTIFHLIECNIGFPLKNASHPSAIARLINIKEYFGSEIFSLIDYSIDDMIENFKVVSNFRMF